MGSFLSKRRSAAAPLSGAKRAAPSGSGGSDVVAEGCADADSAPPPAKRAAPSPQPASAGGMAVRTEMAAAPTVEMEASPPRASQPRVSAAAAAAALPSQRSSEATARRKAEAAEAKHWSVRLTHAQAVSDGGQLLRSTLQANGFCLVTGVISDASTLSRWSDDLRALLAQVALGDDLAAVPGAVDALFAASHDDARWPSGLGDGVFDGYGAGHVAAAWEARLHPRVRSVFAALWRTRRLVASLDGFAAERPRSLPASAQPALHSDENPHGPGCCDDAMHCVQGALSLSATAPETGGTSVVARSHKFHRELLTAASPEANAALLADPAMNWHELSDVESEWLLQQPGCEVRRVATAPGDLLLWDSRTIHCGRRASAALPADAWRLALFLCFWPADKLDASHRAAKAKLMGVDAASGAPLAGCRPESSTHWPDGREAKPRFGWPSTDADWPTNGDTPWTRPRPADAHSDGVMALPAAARSKAALRVAGVLPYGGDSDAEDAEAQCAWMAATDR